MYELDNIHKLQNMGLNSFMKLIKLFSFLLILFAFAISLSRPNFIVANEISIVKSNSNFISESNDIIGKQNIYIAKDEDTLLDLARDNGLGFIDIIAANQGIDPWVPGAGTKIILPTAHIVPQVPKEGLVINLAEQRLYLFESSKQQPITFPIGVGRDGWGTPLGTTKIIEKKVNPFWFPPKSIREENPDLPIAVAPGPNNPLGTHALYFDIPGYLIHGTNRPWGVGRRVSHGCIRLYPEDITKLFDQVTIGLPVRIINQPVKVGWLKGQLYIEAHPDPEQADHLEAKGKIKPLSRELSDDYFRIKNAAGKSTDRLNWVKIREALERRSGLPIRITD